MAMHHLDVADSLTILRVANGWVIRPGPGAAEFTHVATTPDDLAAHVKAWATPQIEVGVGASIVGTTVKPPPLPKGT